MNPMSLDVPWALTPPSALAERPMASVEVLPEYASELVDGVPEVLDEPWSKKDLGSPEPTGIASLDGMVL